MTTIERRERGSDLAPRAGIPVGPRASRREQFELLGLLVGILLILLVLALTLGVRPSYLT